MTPLSLAARTYEKMKKRTVKRKRWCKICHQDEHWTDQCKKLPKFVQSVDRCDDNIEEPPSLNKPRFFCLGLDYQKDNVMVLNIGGKKLDVL